MDKCPRCGSDCIVEWNTYRLGEYIILHTCDDCGYTKVVKTEKRKD